MTSRFVALRIIEDISTVRQNRREGAPIILSRLESAVYNIEMSQIGEKSSRDLAGLRSVLSLAVTENFIQCLTIPWASHGPGNQLNADR